MKKTVSMILIIVVITIVSTSCNQFNIGVDEAESVEEKSLILDGPNFIQIRQTIQFQTNKEKFSDLI